jgi:hydroxymethylpyrimidine pyrophosphatase-like HAD family hydrolase
MAMAGFIQALAFDLDGTLTNDDGLSDEALAAIFAVRADGVAAILVTGRIFADLSTDFPGLSESFDAIVAENGGVLSIDGGELELAGPVEQSLADALAVRGVPVRRGRVLLACQAADVTVIAEEIGLLGLDCHMLRNRSALMVLPSGISKGSGLLSALGELGIAAHNTVAVGDAENDLALIQAAEIGVAVANAVPSLRRHADLVLDRPNGAGVATLLTSQLMTGEQVLRPQRRRVPVGSFPDGTPATVPGAQANVLICGGTGVGKSYVAGLLVEQWTGAAYSVLILDMEGDYVGLDRLDNVVVLSDKLPEAHEVLAMLHQQALSVVLDLSGRARETRMDYLRGLPLVLEAERAAYGMPHWLVIDEAHETFAEGAIGATVLRPADRGYCIVTYRPEQLCAELLATIDVTITATAPAAIGDRGSSIGAATASLREAGVPERSFTVASRRTPHVRHL